MTLAAAEINGDVRLSRADRLRYLWRNARRNLAGLGRGPATRAYHPDSAAIRAQAAGQSPSRLLTQLFLDTELPRLVPPGDIAVLEIGCGSGRMAARLARLGYRGRYTGIDVANRFDCDAGMAPGFALSFQECDAHAFTPDSAPDLMLSVSTLEHIPNDEALVARLDAMMAPGGCELHVVPSGSGLAVYLWHGFRQYTPATIAARFGTRGVDIVRLGGFASLLLHVVAITAPELVLRRSLRRAAPRLYGVMMRAALCADRVLSFCPSAYAIIRRH